MFCIKCGTPLPDDANFCLKCGCDLRNLNQRTGTSYSSVKVGDYVKFGRYPQNNGDVKEPIEWLVLEVNSNEALLISRYGLDCKVYHGECINITWEICDLRKWLNNDFLKEAFSEEERERIKLSEVVNDDNRAYSSGGNNTQDRVFCLSLAEAEQYFKNDSERQCWPTAHTRNQGAGVYNGNGCCIGCCWWLRSPGYDQSFASGVYADGALYPRGDCVDDGFNAVRPALRIIVNT